MLTFPVKQLILQSRRSQSHNEVGKQKVHARSDHKGKSVLTSDGGNVLFNVLLLNMDIGLDCTKLMAAGRNAVRLKLVFDSVGV
jgi:hypothetical protein